METPTAPNPTPAAAAAAAASIRPVASPLPHHGEAVHLPAASGGRCRADGAAPATR